MSCARTGVETFRIVVDPSPSPSNGPRAQSEVMVEKAEVMVEKTEVMVEKTEVMVEKTEVMVEKNGGGSEG